MAEGEHGARVLVVDDRRSDAAFLTTLLGAAGFRAAYVRSRRAAVRVVHDEGVAVVLAAFGPARLRATTDLVTALRSRPEPGVRDVGIVTLLDDESDARFGLGVESDAVLIRPVEAATLTDVVTDVAATDPATRGTRRDGRRPVGVVAVQAGFSE